MWNHSKASPQARRLSAVNPPSTPVPLHARRATRTSSRQGGLLRCEVPRAAASSASDPEPAEDGSETQQEGRAEQMAAAWGRGRRTLEPPPPLTTPRQVLFIRRLGRGQTISYDGTAIVAGDIPVGASVEAGGDVIVLGRLLGKVAGGTGGDMSAKVFAAYMAPTSLSIAGMQAVHRGSPAGWWGRIHSQYAAIATEPDGKGSAPSIRISHTALPPARIHATHVADSGIGSAGRAALFTGAYIFLAGVALLIAPQTALSLLFRPGSLPAAWARIFGVLCTVFGVYYAGTALGEASGMGAEAFYWATVGGRLYLSVIFVILVATGAFPEPGLLVLAAVNFLGAVAMLRALPRRIRVRRTHAPRPAVDAGTGGAVDAGTGTGESPTPGWEDDELNVS